MKVQTLLLLLVHIGISCLAVDARCVQEPSCSAPVMVQELQTFCKTHAGHAKERKPEEYNETFVALKNCWDDYPVMNVYANVTSTTSRRIAELVNGPIADTIQVVTARLIGMTLGPVAATTQRLQPIQELRIAPKDFKPRCLAESIGNQQNANSNPLADVVMNLDSDIGNPNEVYMGVKEFGADDPVSNFFANIGQLVGRWITEAINGPISDGTKQLVALIEPATIHQTQPEQNLACRLVNQRLQILSWLVFAFIAAHKLRRFVPSILQRCREL